MSLEDKQSWLESRWSEFMVPEDASEDWKAAFLGQLKDSLPSKWSAEQTKAWTELQVFLDDPMHRDPNRQLWNIMVRLNPEKMSDPFRARSALEGPQ